jgi:REP element-mobilizing transposase RayT
MSEYIHKKHDVMVLMYHIVCPAKYSRTVFSAKVEAALREVCLEIEKRYEMKFLEIGADKDHVHFLVQSVPVKSVTEVVRIIKSITAREIFGRCPELKSSCGEVNFGRADILRVVLGNMATRR